MELWDYVSPLAEVQFLDLRHILGVQPGGRRGAAANHTQDALQAGTVWGSSIVLYANLELSVSSLEHSIIRATLRQRNVITRCRSSLRRAIRHSRVSKATYCNNNIVIFCICCSYRSGDVSDLCIGQRVWRLLLKRFLCFCRCGGGAPSCCINSAPVY